MSDIETVTARADMPVNVMCMPELPDFATLKQCGVARISMGNFVHDKMYRCAEHTLKAIAETQGFTPVFKECL